MKESYHKIVTNNLNLITLKVQKRFKDNGELDYVDIFGYFGEDYPKSKFFNLWNSSNHDLYSTSHHLFTLGFVFYDNESSVNKDIISSSQEKYFINDNLMHRNSNIRMHSFYVYPNYVKYDINTNTFVYIGSDYSNYESLVSVKDISTYDEYQLYKGIGRETLLWTLENLNEFNENSNMIIEASGGMDVEDMIKLTNYYRHIGFYPINESDEYLKLGYSEFHVVMMSKVHEVINAIKNYNLDQKK